MQCSRLMIKSFFELDYEKQPTWIWKVEEICRERQRCNISACTITGSSPSLWRCRGRNSPLPALSNGTKFPQPGSKLPAIWMPEKAIYPTSPTTLMTKPRGVVALATSHSLHESGSRGVDAKKAASISLVSNLTCIYVKLV